MGINDVNAMMFRQSAPTISFEVGTEVIGTLIDSYLSHDREYKKDGTIGDPLYWSASNKVTTEVTDRPKNTPVLVLQTSLRNDADDDGKRRLFLKGRSKDNPGAPFDTFMSAVRASGAKELEPGGYVRMKCIRKDGDGNQAPKYYEAQYKTAADNDHESKNMIQATKPKKKDPFGN